MRIALRAVSYLAALALFAGGAYMVGTHVAASLADAKETPTGFLELSKLALKGTPASPVWHLWAGLGTAAAGLILARPVLSITLGVRKPKAERSVRSLVHDLGSPDATVRLEAAKALTQLADPGSIPALIKALRDPVPKVRGQACEALLNLTGFDFDFVDVASESVREESVRRWEAWWAANKSKILAGADPKTLGAEIPAPPAPESPRRTSPIPGGTRAVSRTTPAPAAGTSQSGRNVSLGELIRRKRERERTPLPGTERLEPTPKAASNTGAPEQDEPSAPPPAQEEAAEPSELPNPDEELPPPPM